MNPKKQNNLIQIHHGTCDGCQERNTLVCHLNYENQPKRDFRICKQCYLTIDWGDEK